MIVEITHYFAKPDQADAVVAHRRAGCRLRETLGLPPGRMFRKLQGDGPDVRWECTFANLEDLQSDLRAREASVAFAEQRRVMGTLTTRFERHIQILVED